MTASEESAHLVRLTLAGDKAAFVRLVELHANVVYGLARQNAPVPAEAEDIAQESFLRAYRDLRKLRKAEQFCPWLYGITLNVARERRRKGARTVPLDSVPEPAAPEEQSAPSTRESQLLAQVASLPEKYRVPLTLHYLKGMKFREIGEALDIEETTARSLVHRARAKLLAMSPEDEE
jgi:RNA polymerase sigma-70 factor (ECF subfamily)